MFNNLIKSKFRDNILCLDKNKHFFFLFLEKLRFLSVEIICVIKKKKGKEETDEYSSRS